MNCSNGGTVTTVNSSITVTAATWYKLVIEINAAGNTVNYYITAPTQGTAYYGTIITNVPALTTALSPAFVLTKTIGTVASTVALDYVTLSSVFSIPRLNQ